MTKSWPSTSRRSLSCEELEINIEVGCDTPQNGIAILKAAVEAAQAKSDELIPKAIRKPCAGCEEARKAREAREALPQPRIPG
jgi:hypothetical protein